MKVLMVGPSRNGNGGMATVVNNYFNSELVEKIQLKFVSSTIDGNISVRLIYNFFALIHILFLLIFDREIDIVHVHMSHRGSFYRKAIIINLSKLFKKRVVIHLHSSEFAVFYEKECSNKQKEYIAKIFKKADSVIVLSEEWKEKVTSWFSCNISVLYNSIFINEKNQYNKDSLSITLLGRLNERKGTYDLIQVVKSVCEKYKNLKFVLAGDGDLDKLKIKINELGIEKYVDILGWIDSNERHKVLLNTMIYVLPSYNEGMPMSILEAMSYGIPVVASDVGGIPKVIEEGVNGYMIKPGDIKSLKANITRLLDNPELRQEFSNNGYKKAKDMFDINAHINKLMDIYGSIT